jgi:hypothetical protein
MPNRFSSGKFAIAQCDRCGFRFKLKELKTYTLKTKQVNMLVCTTCWDPDHPQLQLGMYPVEDPQAVRNPRPDTTYQLGGTSGLQIASTSGTDPDEDGTATGGSRVFQWGWNPVGGSSFFDDGLTPNNLVLTVVLYPSPVPAALLSAVAGFEPQKTQFATTKINGRPLGDINNNGVLNVGDVSAYLNWVNGTLTDTAQIAYIVGVMNPYMLANPITYATYVRIA